MSMIATAVRGLSNPDGLIPVLRNLGQRHAGYGVTDAHYATVATALVWTLEQGLGADFTPWINHFKNEVYNNWIVPQPPLMGFRAHVDLEMTVERDGGLSKVRMLKSSGTPAVDRAAQNALLGSRFLPLPSDFAPERVTIQVTFFYNEAPAGS